MSGVALTFYILNIMSSYVVSIFNTGYSSSLPSFGSEEEAIQYLALHFLVVVAHLFFFQFSLRKFIIKYKKKVIYFSVATIVNLVLLSPTALILMNETDMLDKQALIAVSIIIAMCYIDGIIYITWKSLRERNANKRI